MKKSTVQLASVGLAQARPNYFTSMEYGIELSLYAVTSNLRATYYDSKAISIT